MFLTYIYPNGFTAPHSKNAGERGVTLRAVRLGGQGGVFVCVCVRGQALLWHEKPRSSVSGGSEVLSLTGGLPEAAAPTPGQYKRRSGENKAHKAAEESG